MRFSLILGFVVGVLAFTAQADDYQETIKTFRSSDVGKSFFSSAYGYAVFPTIGKGGIGVGAAHGRGQVYRGGVVTGTTTMTQLSVGFQLGGQAYSQIVFFEDKRAYEDFTSGNFEFAAGASAIAITASAQASTSTTGTNASTGTHSTTTKQLGASYTKGLAVLTVAKGGLMYEASLAGQKYTFTPK
ncbi:YSC84-related protein [Simiduia agarivorans]|uniref:Ysc84 actin-binding domain-containing protein n=1 Tax=Simiduia agarivorans (strain DSM 21679 / JCM 13881 / BCRC 17597 / SA1) TaxID=1117647 RepID=K4KMQ3_SIMAS|nr:YSC84-related protein [Simiduia agarivorans]AFV00297.1 hypothetical protein M5M_15820 [Simiduia agarivorans SA1 = DSM 21679]